MKKDSQNSQEVSVSSKLVELQRLKLEKSKTEFKMQFALQELQFRKVLLSVVVVPLFMQAEPLII